jgi:hypothetical protein
MRNNLPQELASNLAPAFCGSMAVVPVDLATYTTAINLLSILLTYQLKRCFLSTSS